MSNMVSTEKPRNHPSIENMIKAPYGVFSEGAFQNNFSSQVNFSFSNESDNKKEFVSFLKSLQNNERTKEQSFLNALCNNITKENPFLGNKIRAIMKSNFSEAYNLIKLAEKGLLKDQQNLTKNLDSFEKKWEEYMNTKFIEVISKTMKGNRGGFGVDKALNVNLGDVLDSAWEEFCKQIEQDMEKEFITMNQEIYEQFKELILQNTNSLLGISNSENISLKTILTQNQKRRLLKNKKSTKKRISGEVDSFLKSLVIKGMPAEIVIGSGKIRTGAIKTTYSSLTGGKSVGSIQSDVVELYSLEGEIENNIMSQVTSALKVAKGQEFQRLQNLLGFLKKDHFIVHTSIKDYIPESPQINIRSEAHLSSRLQELKRIAKNIGGSSIDNLIFAILNTAERFINENAINEVVEMIASISVAWMFEDYEENFAIQYNNNANTIHCYFINGKYYLISDILEQLIIKVQNIQEERLVQIKLTPNDSTIKKYQSTFSEKKDFMERWNAVRSELLKGNLTIKFQLNELKQILNL